MKKILILTILFLLLPAIASALTISPPIIDLELEPGETREFELKVFNETDQDQYLALNLTSFKAGEVEGQAKIDETKAFKHYFSWFAFSEASLVLKPYEIKKVRAVINIPVNATPGGYYLAALWRSSASPAEKTPIGILGEVGHLIFLRVEGEIEEKGEVIDFTIEKAKGFLNPLPVVFSLNFENQGNIHLQPQGKIEIRNKFGKLIKELEINSLAKRVMPGDLRNFQTVWFNPWQLLKEGKVSLRNSLPYITEPLAFGKYKATLIFSYGSDSQEIVTEQNFYLFSGYFILLIILVAFLIILLIFLIRRWGKPASTRSPKKKKVKKVESELDSFLNQDDLTDQDDQDDW